MKAMVLALGLAAVLAGVVGLSLALFSNGAQAQAQAGPVAPANVRAVNGAETGQAVVRWDAVAGAAYYRIGWVNMETFRAVQAEGGREWLDVFAFQDVVNRGQTIQTRSDLAPGVEYAFIVTSVGHRFGNARSWSEWAYLTTAGVDTTSCPTEAGTAPEAPVGGSTPTPAPGATAIPAPTATPVATATPAPTATPAATATPTATPAPVGRDYDTDDDGLIEIASLAQLDVIRHDRDGDGVSDYAGYAAAFPNAMADMGCIKGCSGYELTADLDFAPNGNSLFDAGDTYWNDGAGWLPIGDPETPFRYNAVFDGNGHTIANLYIRRADASHIGFFRATGEDAVIRNLGLTALRITGGGDRVGGLVGDNDGAIVNSYTAGRVAGGGRVGGLAGFNSGRISGSYSSVPVGVSGIGDYVGGLVGYSVGSIDDSHATGSVAGESDYVGGLVGYSAGSIDDSYATGSVTSGSDRAGGLVGYSSGAITASYATGDVTGESRYVGGLVGINHDGAITASYATGSVTGAEHWVGGLVGYSDGTITASYATGRVAGEGIDVGGLVGYSDGAITASYAVGRVTGKSGVGGLVGTGSSSSVTSSYWDAQTTGQSRSEGGLGKTTRELQAPTANTGIYAGWNAEWWDFGTSRQYPALKYRGMDVAAQRR